MFPALLTIEADLRLPLDEAPWPVEDADEVELTVDIVDTGDIVEVRPDKELNPESEWL